MEQQENEALDVLRNAIQVAENNCEVWQREADSLYDRFQYFVVNTKYWTGLSSSPEEEASFREADRLAELEIEANQEAEHCRICADHYTTALAYLEVHLNKGAVE